MTDTIKSAQDEPGEEISTVAYALYYLAGLTLSGAFWIGVWVHDRL